MALSEKRQAEKKGRRAEALVAWRLQLGGWKILARRFRSPYGEIDLVAAKPGRLMVVEVKYTSRLDDDMLEAVFPTIHQQRRIVSATRHFIATRPELSGHEINFGVALVRPWGRIRFIFDQFSET